MIKKITFLFIACFVASFFMKAQITSIEYPSGVLTEAKITQLLDNSRKKGIKEFEIEIQNNILHKVMQQQKTNSTLKNNQKGVVVPPHVNSSSCVNPGFENGTTNGWTFVNGLSYNAGTASSLPCDSCLNSTSNIINQVVSSTDSSAKVNLPSSNCSISNPVPFTNGVDNYGGFPVVAPGGGTYSLLLNNTCAGAKMQQAQYTFVVDSSLNIFSFQYAAVLQDGGHPFNESAYFKLITTDLTTGVDIPCGQYYDVATSGSITGWITSTTTAANSGGGIFYKPWTTVSVDLQSAIGHTVTVKLTISDCNQTGHFGYCYIDAACGNVNLINEVKLGLCDTSATVTIDAPTGYLNYQWYGPNNNTPIIGDSTKTIKVAANLKDTFTVKCNSNLGCPLSLRYVISPGTVDIYSPTDTINPGDTLLLTSTGAINYTWTSSDGGSYSGDSISVFPLTNTTYTVVGSDSIGCSDTASKRIYVVARLSRINQISGNNNQISIYPNPANEMLYIDCKLKNATLFITDLIGNKIKQANVENELTTLDISTLSKGVYFLNIKTANNVITKKFIIQR
jgi:hypothetical protein